MSVYSDILKKYWGYSSFRPLQEDIIRSVADDGLDTLGLLPTGGGKSIIFQVPALALNGVCIVVTPLIALMKDQVDNLNRRGIKAVAIFSGMTFDEMRNAFDACCYGGCKFLYLSPERLATDLFLERIKDMQISLLAIDEAHCISQWGYDFRPSYLKIAQIRQYIPTVPILALTATATPEVAEDIQDKLGFKKHNLFRKSFYRKNLVYIVRQVEDKLAYLLKIVNNQQGTGIVYVRSRGKTREIAKFLQSNGVSATYYHAGLSPLYKDQRQKEWKNGNVRIIVATNAFGMGIDKPDVRFVVHIDVPDSLEAYFQEAGRGGRDEKLAYAVLLYNNRDLENLRRNVENAFPPRDYCRKVYAMICNFFQLPIGGGKGQSFQFKIERFNEFYGNVKQFFPAVAILQRNGYLEFEPDPYSQPRFKFLVSPEDLYKFQVANAKYDTFIKILLRNFTGVFGDYAVIDVWELALKSHVSPEVFENYLASLSKLGVLSYIPRMHNPIFRFTEERLPEESVRIDYDTYENLKVRYLQRVTAMIDYCINSDKCRSQQLTLYFGENLKQPCGNCDVCRKKK